jgi:hypothetical protein
MELKKKKKKWHYGQGHDSHDNTACLLGCSRRLDKKYEEERHTVYAAAITHLPLR